MGEDADDVVNYDCDFDYGNEAVDDRGSSLADFSAGDSGHPGASFPKMRSQPSRKALLAVTTAKLGRSYFM